MRAGERDADAVSGELLAAQVQQQPLAGGVELVKVLVLLAELAEFPFVGLELVDLHEDLLAVYEHLAGIELLRQEEDVLASRQRLPLGGGDFVGPSISTASSANALKRMGCSAVPALRMLTNSA